MIAIQMLFVERVDSVLVVDGIVVDSDPNDPQRLWSPVTMRFRLPDDPHWAVWLTELVRGWTDRGEVAHVTVRRGRACTVADLVGGRSRLTLDLVES